MINTDMSNPETYYSPYGYIEVSKSEYTDRDKEMIKFRKKQLRLFGTIRVSLFKNKYKSIKCIYL